LLRLPIKKGTNFRNKFVAILPQLVEEPPEVREKSDLLEYNRQNKHHLRLEHTGYPRGRYLHLEHNCRQSHPVVTMGYPPDIEIRIQALCSQIAMYNLAEV